MHKTRTSFKTLASKKATTWRLKNKITIYKLLGKIMPSSYHVERKTSKQVVTVKYTLKERLFGAATFKGLFVVSFKTK